MSTGISWTDETWTIVTGCSKVSAGCKNCYAERLALRLAAMEKSGYTDKPWTMGNAAENVTLRPERLEQPLRWRKPRRVFVTSMGDLFHELVPDEFVDRVFAVMALSPQHTFQILTKRPERMASYLSDANVSRRVGAYMALDVILDGPPLRVDAGEMAQWRREGIPLPLPNVWLGTSVEDQRAAGERIPHLLNTPAAVRFLSCEPLIGPVDLVLSTAPFDSAICEPGKRPVLGTTLAGLDWVIAGGESGPGFRPMDPEWPRSLRDQCVNGGVPYFFKQWGGLRSEGEALLDGEEWHQFPDELKSDA